MCCGAVVVDETRLQGAAVRTAIRLQQLHQELGGPAQRELVLCSATLDAAILPTATPRHGLSDADYSHPVAQRKVGRTKLLTQAGDTDPPGLGEQPAPGGNAHAGGDQSGAARPGDRCPAAGPGNPAAPLPFPPGHRPSSKQLPNPLHPTSKPLTASALSRAAPTWK